MRLRTGLFQYLFLSKVQGHFTSKRRASRLVQGDGLVSCKSHCHVATHSDSKVDLQLSVWHVRRPEPTYEVDLRQLEGEYKMLQKDLHPDKFGSRGAQQQHYSAEQSSLVNRAYTVLRDPLQRALYLVRLDTLQPSLFLSMAQQHGSQACCWPARVCTACCCCSSA